MIPQGNHAHDRLFHLFSRHTRLHLFLYFDPVIQSPCGILQDPAQVAPASLGDSVNTGKVPNVLHITPVPEIRQQLLNRNTDTQLALQIKKFLQDRIMFFVNISEITDTLCNGIFHGISRL